MRHESSVAGSRVCATVGVCLVAWVAALTGPLAAQGVVVSSAVPASAEQGTSGLEVTITGEGFEPGAKVDFLVGGTPNPGGIVVTSAKVQGSRKIIATIDVGTDAVASSFDVKVTLKAGRTGKGTDLFTVIEKVTGSPNQPPPPLDIASTPSIATLGGPMQVLQPAAGGVHEVTWWQTESVDYRDVAFGDVDGDASVELIAARVRCGSGSASKRKCWMRVDVFEQGSTGAPASTSSEIANGNSPYSVEVVLADVHPAPGREIVVAGQRGVGVLRFDAGSGALVTLWSTVWTDGFFKSAKSLAVGDLDGDGLAEILLGSTLGFVRVYRVSGNVWTSFDTESTAAYGLPPWLYRAHVADLDGDAVSELVAVAWSSDSSVLPILAVWSRQGATDWRLTNAVVVDVVGPGTHFDIAVSDMDADPAIEIAFVARRQVQEFRVGVWEWTGVPGAELATVWQQGLASYPSRVSFDDVDGDGPAELVVSGSHDAGSMTGETFYLEVFDWNGNAGQSRWELLLDCPYVTDHAVR